MSMRRGTSLIFCQYKAMGFTASRSRLAAMMSVSHSPVPQFLPARHFHRPMIYLCEKSVQPTKTKEDALSETEVHNFKGAIGRMVKPTKADKFLLVFTKLYEKKEDIPNLVSVTQLNKAHDLGRIYLNLCVLVFATFVGASLIFVGRWLRRTQKGWRERKQEALEKLREDYIRKQKETESAATS